jgi:hypothetical protein
MEDALGAFITIKEYNEWLKKVSPNTQQGEET